MGPRYRDETTIYLFINLYVTKRHDVIPLFKVKKLVEWPRYDVPFLVSDKAACHKCGVVPRLFKYAFLCVVKQTKDSSTVAHPCLFRHKFIINVLAHKVNVYGS